MGLETLIADYIGRCDDVLACGDAHTAEKLAGEILSVFSASIEGLKSGLDMYSPGYFVSFGGRTAASPSPDYLSDINKLRGKLKVEISRISGSTPMEKMRETSKETATGNKPYKIFISHSSKDRAYVGKLVKLLEEIGVQEENLFCSSVDGYGVPLGENIYNYLREQFENFQLHIIFALSDNYYNSVPCLNEMGAAWVLRQSYISALLPGFKHRQIDGAVDPRDIALDLNATDSEINQRLYELMNLLCTEFQIKQPSSAKWERIRNEFKSGIKDTTEKVSKNDSDESEPDVEQDKDLFSRLSHDAKVFLAYAGSNDRGEVIVSRTLSGTSINAGDYDFVSNGGARAEARWMAVIKELERFGMLENKGATKVEVYHLTHEGFQNSDKARESIDTNNNPKDYLE